jgi:hypothetical protein
MDKMESVARSILGARDPILASAAAAVFGSLARWLSLPELLDRIEAAGEAIGGWEGALAELRAHQAILRSIGAGATDADSVPPPGTPSPGRPPSPLGASLSLPQLRASLPALLAVAEAAATHERSELRQPAAHALARLCAAFGEADPTDDANENNTQPGNTDKDETGDETEMAGLAAAAALGVPRSAVQALARLAADPSSEVRASVCNAVKRLARLRPAVLSAGTGTLGAMLIPPLAAAAQVRGKKTREASGGCCQKSKKSKKKRLGPVAE